MAIVTTSKTWGLRLPITKGFIQTELCATYTIDT